MQVFVSKGLVFLAVPKTATTSLEAALAPAADSLQNDLFPKHISARMFFRRWQRQFPEAPQLDAFAVIRNPLDRLKSWYRYRRRSEIAGSANSTADVTFEEFVEEYLREDRRPFADIGNQHRFCTDQDGQVLVKYLFSFENLPILEEFLRNQFGLTKSLPHLNGSSEQEFDLSQRTLSRLERANASEFELYEAVSKNGLAMFEPKIRL